MGSTRATAPWRGRSFAGIWAEAWDDISPIARRAYDGESTYIENYPLRVQRSGQPQQAWFTFCYSPLRLADRSTAGMLDTAVETSAAVKARADQALLNTEIGHRLKNPLALVQGIAGQTLRGVTERDAVDALDERLRRERDGPPVEAPQRKGFGSRLIDRSFAGATVERSYATEGCALCLAIPLAGLRDG